MSCTTEEPSLLGGPYLQPVASVGDWLPDEIDGLLEVGGWTAAPIPWPRRKKTGRPSLILTTELVRAVQTESVEAICYHWGVRPTKVWMWRTALGVGRVTDGTRHLLRERTGVPPDAAARGREVARSPESRAKIAAAKRGKPAPAQTRMALLRAAKRPKGAAWGVRANAWMLGRTLPPLVPHHTPYSDADILMLRTLYPHRPALAVALLMGRTIHSVRQTAYQMGISRLSGHARGRPKKTYRSRGWSSIEDTILLGQYMDTDVRILAAALGRSTQSIRVRAHRLGLKRRVKNSAKLEVASDAAGA